MQTTLLETPERIINLVPSSRIRPTSSCTIPDDPLLDALLSAEAIVRQLRSSVITRTVDARRQATTCDVTDRQVLVVLRHEGFHFYAWKLILALNLLG